MRYTSPSRGIVTSSLLALSTSFFEANPATHSPTCRHRRIAGLHVASVRTRWNGFGANLLSSVIL